MLLRRWGKMAFEILVTEKIQLVSTLLRLLLSVLYNPPKKEIVIQATYNLTTANTADIDLQLDHILSKKPNTSF